MASASPTCRDRLTALGVAFEAAAPPAGSSLACTIDDPVRLTALPIRSGQVRLPDRPVLACAFAERLSGFMRDLAAPLAHSTTGRPMVALSTGPGFECRPRNRVAGARISTHGRGLAIDIAAIELEGRHRIVVAAPTGRDDAALLGALRKAACGWFTTVLGPGSDAAHHDHLHFDAEVRGRNGDSRLCQ